jgi:N-acetylglutamate synthase-like GNAT family acetyltransferase
LLIETANVNDAQEILLLQKLAYQSEAKLLDELKMIVKSHIFLKATIDSKIVGAVRASMNNGTCRIGRLIVNPEFQNQGIGTKLLAEIEQKCNSCKRFELFTGNKSVRNIHFYEKAGYKAFKTMVVSDKLSLVCFEKVVTK